MIWICTIGEPRFFTLACLFGLRMRAGAAADYPELELDHAHLVDLGAAGQHSDLACGASSPSERSDRCSESGLVEKSAAGE